MAARGRDEPYEGYQGYDVRDPGRSEIVNEFGDPVAQDRVDLRDLVRSGRRTRRRRGLHLGPVAVTPTRVTLLIALVGSVGFLGYAITVRDPSQIPLLASGAAVLGIVFAALALAGAISAVRAGQEGAGGRSFAMALGGGVAGVIAFGCFGAAIVLALVWRR
ncbi:MAG: hypothetical protein FJ038_00625 [Chloroflexi bacterium]|nr:hypothetical protein [Chloroflexota bacterium]